jgi:hypothetical protein
VRSLLGTVILYCYCTVVITVTYWTEKKLPSNHRISKNIGWLFSYRTVGFFNTKIPIEAIRIYQFTYWRSGIPNSTWGGNIFPIPAPYYCEISSTVFYPTSDVTKLCRHFQRTQPVGLWLRILGTGSSNLNTCFRRKQIIVHILRSRYQIQPSHNSFPRYGIITAFCNWC